MAAAIRRGRILLSRETSMLKKSRTFFEQNWKFVLFWIIGMAVYKVAERLGWI